MKSILLVEDDPFLIDIYTTKLKDSGFSVEVAKEGESALRKLNEEKFDFLLLDIVLPQIDGWEILEKIKNQKPKTKNLEDLKIVVLSNLGQKEEVEKGLRLGADKYLIKAHYTPSEVVEEIKEVLRNYEKVRKYEKVE
jgi:DNA-binding response OmpR family regulator